MLKIYNQNREAVGYITRYKEARIESILKSGDKTLSFESRQSQKADGIGNEYYVETKTDRFVVKEVGVSSDGFPEYTCQLDLEDLEADMFENFSAVNVTLTDAANLALAGTGWRVSTDITKTRSVATMKATPLTLLGKIRDAWMCEIRYDNINRIVYFAEQFGEDKGVFFEKTLNLRKLSLTSDSYDYYTRIIPIGKDDLRINNVNNGVGYVENYQYSSKIRTLIWEDTSYEDAQALKEDAGKKLEDLSKPKKSYSADIVDIAKQNTNYSIMSFGLGDTITIIDETTGIREKQRIVKLTEYQGDPAKNTCELSNTTLTWEEQQDRIEKAAEALENITNSDGTVNGVYVHGVEADGVVGIETVINESSSVQNLNQSVSTIQGDISVINGELSAVKARVGTVETTYLKATDAELTYATIGRAEIIEADVHDLSADYAKFKTVTAGEFSATNAQITNVSGDLANYKTVVAGELQAVNAEFGSLSTKYATIDLANIAAGTIQTAMIDVGAVQTAQIADGSITDAKIVELTANKITAGTLAVERLEIRGSTSSIVYALNNITGALQAQNVDTINGEILTPRTITADRIVANAITGNEIATKTLTANHIAANSITGAEIAAATITADKIDVSDLFAQNITATGTITGVKLAGATGSFTGSVSATSFDINGSTISIENKEYERVYYSYKEETGNINSASTAGTEDCFLIDSVLALRATSAEFTTLYTGFITSDKAAFGELTAKVIRSTNTIINGYRPMLANSTNGFWGLTTPEGNNTDWIRTTSNGIIPYASGGASSLGTSSWPFNTIYGVNFYASNWFHTIGAYGWYNETYGGGIYMNDSVFVKVYGSKKFYCGNEIVSASSNAFRAVWGNYGFFIRNDGSDAYFLITNSGDQHGSWNSLRPLRINLSNGMVHNETGINLSKSTYLLCGGQGVLRIHDAGNYSNLVQIGNSGYVVSIYSSGNVWKNGSTTTYFATTSSSDKRLKDEVSDMSVYEDFFMDLTPVAFRYHEGLYNAPGKAPLIQWGFYAQDVISAFQRHGIDWEKQELVVVEDGDLSPAELMYAEPGTLLKMNYQNLTALNTHMVQKCAGEIARHDGAILSHSAQIELIQCQLQKAFERIMTLEKENELLKSA